MSSSKLLQRPSKKASGSNELLGFDLLFQLTYLSAISAAGIPRSQIFRLAAELPSTAARYFYEVDRLAQAMNYQYAEACRIVGEAAKEPEAKSLLLRLSSALGSGEREMDFLAEEAKVQAEAYGNIYEGKLEVLKKWTDAHAALIVSSVLIIVVAAISTVIWDMGIGFVTGLVGVMIAMTGLGTWLIYRMAPQEVKVLTGERGRPSQKVPRMLFITLMPSSLVIASLLGLQGVPLGVILIVVAAMLFPIGLAASRYDTRVSKMDSDISTFLRALGATSSAIGTTPGEALGRLDLRSMASLATPVKNLHTLLLSRARLERAWGRFVVETGSELISRSVRVFLDGIGLGGDPEEVGDRASLLAMKVNFLRAKRKLVSSTFGWLTMAIHAVIVFLLIFVIDIISGFGELLIAAGVQDLASGQGAAAASVLSFNFVNIRFLRWLMVPVIVVLSMVNAVAPKAAEGGYGLRVFFYLSMTLFTSGVSLVASPRIVASLFGAVESF